MKIAGLLLLACAAAVSLGDEHKPTSPIDPAVVGAITDDDLADARRHPLPPPELKASPAHHDFDLKGDATALFEQVGKAYNLLVVFDTAFQPGRPVRFQMTDAGYREALRALQDATDTFVIPVGERLILVANDTQQKRTELDSTAAIVIPIPEPVAVQEVQELATAVRGALDIQRLMVDNARRLVLIRDRVWKVRAAQMLFKDLMLPRAQVAIELDILAASESTSRHYGFQLPTSSQLVAFGGAINKWPKNLLTSIPAGFTRFLAFGGGASFLGLGLTDATLFATATKATSTSLFKSEMVTVDGQPATMHVGDKYPIVTGSYFAPPVSGQQFFTPPPQVNFEDLGLLVKVTPHVHGTEEMTLEVSAEFKLLGAGSVDGIPVISERKFESKVRLVNGEWAVLAGLMSVQDAKIITGIPGLTLIPMLHEDTRTHDRGDTMIILKPHLLRLPASEALTHTEWVGTETKPRNL